MPPKLALILCVSFILVVYIRDAKRTPDASRALWVPLIWLLIIASRPVSYWFLERTVVSADDVLNGSPFDRTVLSILIAAGILILLRRTVDWPKLIKNNFWIFLWVFYGGMSILWSDYSSVAFKRYMKEIGTFVMVLIVLTENDPVESVKILLRRCAYALIPLSIILIKYYRDWGVFYSPWGGYANLAGITTDKNGLGRLCLVSGFFFFWTIVTMRRNKQATFRNKDFFIPVLFLVMTLWLLMKAHSATSLAALLIGIVCFLALAMPLIKNNLKFLTVLIAVAVCLFVLLQFTINITEIFVTSMGRDMTLTDRTLLWKELLSMNTHPVFGTGYDSFWIGERLERLWSKYWWAPNEAHNGYLEVYLSLGLIGLFLLAGILISTYKKILRTLMLDFDFGRFRMAFLVMLIFYNITEAAFRGLSQMWFVFLLIGLQYRDPVPSVEKKPDAERDAMPALPEY